MSVTNTNAKFNKYGVPPPPVPVPMGGRSSVLERKSADDNKIYCCTVCYRIEVATYEGWLWHIGSREHQVAVSKSPILNSWRRFDFRKICVYVSGILGLDSREVLDYLKTWGEIEDFYYPFVNKGEQRGARGCLCLYREVESTQALLKEDSHVVNDKSLQVKMKRDVSFGMEEQFGQSNEGQGQWRKRKRNSEFSYRDQDDNGNKDDSHPGKRGRSDNYGNAERRFSY